ncbi:MAG: tRNA preQ1(34) S-adenosylmethionine ribosyltransferase-isomerase QueA [Alphaproteobacteria bacterium]
MDLSTFDFDLPAELIAQHPAPRRDAGRLLVIPREGELKHRAFPDMVDLLREGDLLIRNNTRVIPARLIGKRETGGRVELVLLEPAGEPTRWLAIGRPMRALRPGRRLHFGALTATVQERIDENTLSVSFAADPVVFDNLLAEAGRMPLPPYIKRSDDEDPEVLARDRERYQTVYARQPGAVAAPTAGLHFTDEIFTRIKEKGVEVREVTLHVGAGTFLPIRSEHLEDHIMHSEKYTLPEETAEAIRRCRERGGRLVAVGTTTTRVLETLARDDGNVAPGSGRTELFIKPGHRWRAVDALLTNFHLPKGTLLVLVCALAGTERLLAAYHEAVAQKYRFFSYGDACWIERA